MNTATESLVGKVLVNSWGYSMTIVDFYKVVRETEKTVVVVPLKGGETKVEGFLSGTVMPSEVIDGDKQFRLYKRANGSEQCFAGSLGSSVMHYLRLWDGRPEHFNHCD